MNFRLNPNLDIKLRSWLGGAERVGVASWNNTFVEYLYVLLFLKRFKARWDFFYNASSMLLLLLLFIVLVKLIYSISFSRNANLTK